MNELFCFNLLGNVSLAPRISSWVSSLGDAEWTEYWERKNRGGIAAENSDTIPLIYNPDPSSNLIQTHKYLEIAEELISDVLNSIGADGVRQAMLTRLKSGEEIKRHKDKGPITAKFRRVHVPILTNEKCIFTVGEESVNMAIGEIWIIDNVGKYHSVINGGNTHRVHLIIDAL